MKFKSEFIPKFKTKKFKATTPSLRHRRIVEGPKKLLRLKSNSIKNNAGRNNTGKITTRHHGGRHKRYLRNIDWLRSKGNYCLSNLLSIEYDPNRNANIARYITPKMNSYYILAPEDVQLSIQGINYPKDKFLTDGDTIPFKYMPIGSKCYNIQTRINNKPLFAKSSGSVATLIKKDDLYATIRLPSKKIIKVNCLCLATLGTPSNINKNLTIYGKAGAKRWLGKRPTVKGYAMNPIDHPHGGKTKGGMQPKTKWGKQAKWIKKQKKHINL